MKYFLFALLLSPVSTYADWSNDFGVYDEKLNEIELGFLNHPKRKVTSMEDALANYEEVFAAREVALEAFDARVEVIKAEERAANTDSETLQWIDEDLADRRESFLGVGIDLTEENGYKRTVPFGQFVAQGAGIGFTHWPGPSAVLGAVVGAIEGFTLEFSKGFKKDIRTTRLSEGQLKKIAAGADADEVLSKARGL